MVGHPFERRGRTRGVGRPDAPDGRCERRAYCRDLVRLGPRSLEAALDRAGAVAHRTCRCLLVLPRGAYIRIDPRLSIVGRELELPAVDEGRCVVPLEHDLRRLRLDGLEHAERRRRGVDRRRAHAVVRRAAGARRLGREDVHAARLEAVVGVARGIPAHGADVGELPGAVLRHADGHGRPGVVAVHARVVGIPADLRAGVAQALRPDVLRRVRRVVGTARDRDGVGGVRRSVAEAARDVNLPREGVVVGASVATVERDVARSALHPHPAGIVRRVDRAAPRAARRRAAVCMAVDGVARAVAVRDAVCHRGVGTPDLGNVHVRAPAVPAVAPAALNPVSLRHTTRPPSPCSAPPPRRSS